MFRKRGRLVIDVVLVACLMVSAMTNVAEMRNKAQLTADLQEGFELTGTFAYNSSLDHSIYFEKDADAKRIMWGGRTENDDYMTGIVSETGDPNVHLLLTDTGERYATAHLAFSSQKDGMLYVSYDNEIYTPFKKISNSRVTYRATHAE